MNGLVTGLPTPELNQSGLVLNEALPESEDLQNSGTKILVVDDEDAIRGAIKDYLTMRGFEVDIAANGRKALEMLEGHVQEYAVVFTDLNMPIMNGCELLTQIARLNEDIVQIVITGNATRQTAITSLKSGAYDFIEKPFQLRELDATLSRALEKQRLVRENREYQVNLQKRVAERTQQLMRLNETLTLLCRLGQKSRETLNISPKLEDFKQFCLRTFEPDTFALYTQNFDRASLEKTLYHDTRDRPPLEGFEVPPADWFKTREKRIVFNDHKQDVPPQYRIQPENRSIYLFRLEQDMLLGFLYIGFDNLTGLTAKKRLLELYLGEIESALIQDYLIANHREEFRRMFLSSVMTHARTIEVKDFYTRGHCERVERYVHILAERIGLDTDRQYNLKIACILHDIGKIGVPEQILGKPGKLSSTEFETMKNHPVLGGQIVKNLYGFDLEAIIRHHHENFDGSGYPDGLSSEEIPLESRIMAVMDTFDAMTTDRPYRQGRKIEEAVAEIERCSGSQFDPQVVGAFKESLEEIVVVMNEHKKRTRKEMMDTLPQA